MWGCCIRDGAIGDFEAVKCTEEEPESRVAVVLKAEEPHSAPLPEQQNEIEKPQYLEEPKGATPPEEPEPPSSRRVIVFRTPGGDVMVTFTKEPLGISLFNNLPVKVFKVKGHAEELGVQPGWEFKSIDGSLVEGKDFRTVKEELVVKNLWRRQTAEPFVEAPKNAMPPEEFVAPSFKNVVVFTTPGGEDVTITFTKAPIGITFNDKEFPLKTDKVKGHAEELGVQPGWIFKSVGGSLVADKDFRTLKAELVAFSQSLMA